MAKAKKETSILGALGLAAASAAIGTVVGMLTSPASGKKNRQSLAKEGKKLVSTAKKAAKTSEKKITKKLKK
jgi:gas vesicle protein